MSSSAGQALGQPPGPEPAPPDRAAARAKAAPAAGAPGDGQPALARNGLATTALVTGLAGFTVVTIVPSLACAVAGLRRARRAGRGRARCWAAIGLSLLWAALAGYLAPHLARAADPGCTTYKGAGLTAYNRVIDDVNQGAGDALTTRDLTRAVAELDAAAARSASPGTARSLSALAAQLRVVLADVRARVPVTRAVSGDLNRDAARADGACGTLRL